METQERETVAMDAGLNPETIAFPVPVYLSVLSTAELPVAHSGNRQVSGRTNDG